jgi:hypothetical protein
MAVLTKMAGFVVTRNPEKAKAFCAGVLGSQQISHNRSTR